MTRIICDLCGAEMGEPLGTIFEGFSGIEKRLTIRIEVEGDGDVCDPCVRKKLRAMSLQRLPEEIANGVNG